MSSRPSFFTPLKTKRAFEEIADQIRELIYSGVFKAGDKLPSERELANQFQAGRMVVREALRTLEHSGFIEIRQGSFGGAFIKSADPTIITRSISDMIKIGSVTLQELTEVRLGIEMVVMEFALQRMDHTHLDLLKKNIEHAEHQVLQGIRPLDDNLHFHLLLAKASKNTVFEMIVASIMSVTKTSLTQVKPDQKHLKKVLAHHKDIYKAIKEKDFERAKDRMRQHLLDVNRRVSELPKSESLSISFKRTVLIP